MATPWRDVVDAVITAITGSSITGVANWKTHKAEPIYHAAQGQHVAVWFDGFENDQSVGTTGDQEEVCRFGIRYWEAAPEKAAGLVVDEAKAATVEGYLDGLVAVIYDNQGGLGNSYDTRVAAGGTFVSIEGEAQGGGAIRGCEVVFTARIRRNFT